VKKKEASAKKKPITKQTIRGEEPLPVLEGELLGVDDSPVNTPRPNETYATADNESQSEPLETELIDISPDDISIDDVESEDTHPAERSEAQPERGVVPYNPLDAYLSEIRRFTPLSKEAEHAAAVEYNRTKDPEAAYTLVSGSLWLVVKIARDYERVAKNVLDLIQEGNIGLMEAVRNFDPYRGVRFPSYAVWWIRAYIIRYIISNWRMVKIGTTQAQRKLFFNLKKESERLEREGIYPSSKLLAERLNVKEGEVIEMSQRLGGSDMSIDAPLQDEEGESSLLSILPSSVDSIEDQISKRQLNSKLAEAILRFRSTLKAKEIEIFNGRILNEDKLTLQELSDRLLISKERVRQIENRIRDKFKISLEGDLGEELSEWIGSSAEKL
jgi:RNA polymerase sigma-32 factor